MENEVIGAVLDRLYYAGDYREIVNELYKEGLGDVYQYCIDEDLFNVECICPECEYYEFGLTERGRALPRQV